MKILRFVILLAILGLANSPAANAQPVLQNDYSYSLKIPSVVAMASSPAHLYVLSKSDGMAVFRTHRDSLQWLYTASGMQQRGRNIRADIRFAYLFGDGNRLTVLEPTSVMGAYSATRLPQKPRDVLRFGNNLYVAMGAASLGKLNLKTPQTLDTKIQPVASGKLANKNIIDLAASTDQLFALSNDAHIFIFNKTDDDVTFDRALNLDQPLEHLYFKNGQLLGSNHKGVIFSLSDSGKLSELGSIDEPVKTIKQWKNWLIIKGTSNRLWTSFKKRNPTLWEKSGAAGNYLATSKGQLWLCQYQRISRIRQGSAQQLQEQNQPISKQNPSGPPELQPIKNQIIPYPHALLLPLKLKNDFPIANIEFNMETDVKGAEIQGQSLYWKPSSSSVGEHHFKIIATTPGGKSSTVSFSVDVSRFNTPPRFTPLRTISIPVGHPFNLPIKAIDPDATNKNLIRYLGVNLPKGASINEQTGHFHWSPTARSMGINKFRIIATDQYGAAASENVTIRVIKTNDREN